MFKTKITELLEIEYPIFQGGMAWISDAELAAAVSNAGGLGIIAGGGRTAENLRREIRKCKELTNKPFGVNVMLMMPNADEIMQVVLEEKVSVVTTGAGNPGKYIPAFKEAGIKVVPVVASVALAKRMERIGVDAVIAEGTESGGHIGDITTFALVPQVVDAVNIPVIAAGGIADGRGFVAALALGAEGVQIGTAFLAAKECKIHPNYKNKVLKAKAADIDVSGKVLGHPVRCIRNRLTREFNRLEEMVYMTKVLSKLGFSKEDLIKLAQEKGLDTDKVKNAWITKDDLEEFGRGKLRAAAQEGDIEWGSLMAGYSVGLVNKEKTAKEIIDSIISQAKEVLNSLCTRYS